MEGISFNAAASELLQVSASELALVDGCVSHRTRHGGPSIALADIASHLESTGSTKLSADGWHHTTHMNYPYGVHIAVVRVDPGTGGVEIERYLIAYDVGRAINPKLVEAQIVGGFSQGLGGALFEEFRYDERGEPLSTTFAEYLLPGLHEVPHVDVLITEDAPSPLNPLGIKGAGEGGVTAVAAALAGAIDDAIGHPGAVTAIPVTPQRIKCYLRVTR